MINAEGIFLTFFLIWILASLFENRIISHSGQGKKKIKTDRGSALLINVSALGSIIVTYISLDAGLAILPESMFYLGIASIVAGILLREWAVISLRSYFSYRITISEDHKIIENGPYKFIRHPAYAGSIFTLYGLSLALCSGVGLLVVMFLISAVYAYRIRVEEKVLLAELGEEYSKYMERTKQIIPFVK